MLDYFSCPIGIWADFLEDQGEDTSSLRSLDAAGWPHFFDNELSPDGVGYGDPVTKASGDDYRGDGRVLDHLGELIYEEYERAEWTNYPYFDPVFGY